MPLRQLLILTLALFVASVSSQGGSWRLSANPSDNQGQSKDQNQHKPADQSPKPIQRSKAELYQHSPVFEKAHNSGVQLTASLQATHTQPRAKEDKALDLGSYHVAPPSMQWRFQTPFEEIPSTGPYMRVNVFADKSFGNILHPAPYTNVFDVQKGIIGLEWDFKEADKTPDDRRLHLSDILFKSYQRVCQGVAHHVAPRYIVGVWIVSYDTKRVLLEAYERHKTDFSVERTWRPGSVEFESLLGTTHGKVVMHMLMDFCRWSHCSVPSAIKTKYWHPPGQVGAWGWYMMIELREKKSIVNEI